MEQQPTKRLKKAAEEGRKYIKERIYKLFPNAKIKIGNNSENGYWAITIGVKLKQDHRYSINLYFEWDEEYTNPRSLYTNKFKKRYPRTNVSIKFEGEMFIKKCNPNGGYSRFECGAWCSGRVQFKKEVSHDIDKFMEKAKEISQKVPIIRKIERSNKPKRTLKQFKVRTFKKAPEEFRTEEGLLAWRIQAHVFDVEIDVVALTPEGKVIDDKEVLADPKTEPWYYLNFQYLSGDEGVFSVSPGRIVYDGESKFYPLNYHVVKTFGSIHIEDEGLNMADKAVFDKLIAEYNKESR
jgi:hypothetical protein